MFRTYKPPNCPGYARKDRNLSLSATPKPSWMPPNCENMAKTWLEQAKSSWQCIILRYVYLQSFYN